MEFSELAAGIQNHRFDGWTNTAIADQITRMINGDGTGSIGTAVDALKAVATALAHTDQTLRAQLLELGVEWQSQAGGAASQVFTEQAGFSQDATTKVAHAAEMVFEQGEAFNRTKYKLPDAETVRKGAGGFTLTDGLLSLIGFETDHAQQVQAANDAKAQAQQALNEYAQQSGTNLLSTQALSDPESLKLAAPGIAPGVLDVAGAAVAVTPDGGVRPASDRVRSVHVDPPVVQPVSHTVHADPPTPAYGVAAQQPARSAPQPPRQTGSAGSAGAPPAQHTTPSSSTTPSGAKPPVTQPGPGWSHVPGRGTSGSDPGGHFTPGPGAGGQGDPFVPPGAPGAQPPGSAPATTPIKSLGGTGGGGGGGGGGGTSGGWTGIEGSTGRSPDGLLGKGRTVGAMPQAPLQPGQYTGERSLPVKPGATPGDVGAGAAAIGAGVAGGALSGDKERLRREKSGPTGPVRPLPVGELPEEEAVALRKSEQISPKQKPGEPRFLSEAAPQEEDAEHVRRYGVDDQDLFADQRMVSPDVLGDHGRDGR
ncbi:hypothetical protein [Amycolatopsis sp. Hca4]|uniref:hypothetical protein n=1 Tax=Amycolatopsis sp. Hca4 TaxID=2742131 RepID=UPI0015924E8C|nr:hypothetical protein [Amycolatopsis sp. Hca4]QKV77362.1 hypothetical protein HUT10_28965 [Amycolatopsis sp. Hca4]